MFVDNGTNKGLKGILSITCIDVFPEQKKIKFTMSVGFKFPLSLSEPFIFYMFFCTPFYTIVQQTKCRRQ